jgi:hypothetical protein
MGTALGFLTLAIEVDRARRRRAAPSAIVRPPISCCPVAFHIREFVGWNVGWRGPPHPHRVSSQPTEPADAVTIARRQIADFVVPCRRQDSARRRISAPNTVRIVPTHSFGRVVSSAAFTCNELGHPRHRKPDLAVLGGKHETLGDQLRPCRTKHGDLASQPRCDDTRRARTLHTSTKSSDVRGDGTVGTPTPRGCVQSGRGSSREPDWEKLTCCRRIGCSI